MKIQQRKCEKQTLEVKTANKGCPERLYDTFSSFANQNEGGTIVFGLDEKQGFAKVGVYDAQDLQKKLMEVGEAMTPVVRPVLSVYEEDEMLFVAADIPPLDLGRAALLQNGERAAERFFCPCGRRGQANDGV